MKKKKLKKKLEKKIIHLKSLNIELNYLVDSLESEIHFLTNNIYLTDFVCSYLTCQISQNPDVTVQELIDSLNKELGKE